MSIQKLRKNSEQLCLFAVPFWLSLLWYSLFNDTKNIRNDHLLLIYSVFGFAEWLHFDIDILYGTRRYDVSELFCESGIHYQRHTSLVFGRFEKQHQFVADRWLLSEYLKCCAVGTHWNRSDDSFLLVKIWEDWNIFGTFLPTAR